MGARSRLLLSATVLLNIAAIYTRYAQFFLSYTILLHDFAICRGKNTFAIPPEGSPVLRDFRLEMEPYCSIGHRPGCSARQELEQFIRRTRRVLLDQYCIFFFRPPVLPSCSPTCGVASVTLPVLDDFAGDSQSSRPFPYAKRCPLWEKCDQFARCSSGIPLL